MYDSKMQTNFNSSNLFAVQKIGFDGSFEAHELDDSVDRHVAYMSDVDTVNEVNDVHDIYIASDGDSLNEQQKLHVPDVEFVSASPNYVPLSQVGSSQPNEFLRDTATARGLNHAPTLLSHVSTRDPPIGIVPESVVADDSVTVVGNSV